MRSVLRRVWSALRHRRLEAELAREIEFHRAMKIRELSGTGLSAEDASREAARAMGNVRLAQEDARDIWIAPSLHELWQDIRFAVRGLRHDRGFTVAAVLTLALGIGATTTIFSAVYAVLIQPLPFAQADRLLGIWKKNSTRGWIANPISAADFTAWRTQGQAFDEMAAIRQTSCVLTGGGGPHEAPCEIVSSSFFSVLGVAPFRGRAFRSDEDNLGGAPAAILSYGLWQRRFGADGNVVGQPLSINGTPHTIVGVMPAGFPHTYTSPFSPIPELWVSGIALSPTNTSNDYLAVGRLKPGVGLQQAETVMGSASVGLDQMYPDLKGWRPELHTLREMNAGETESALLVLMGAVTLVLLIACANVANLLLARGASRAHEFALRSALGAVRWRVARQLLTEAAVIAVTGGILGMALAWFGTKALFSIAPEYMLNSAPQLSTDPLSGRVLLMAMTASLATTMVFGLVPAIHGARPDVSGTLKETGRRSFDPRRARLRRGLVVSEVALAMVLLVGAGLMTRTLASLHRINLGMDPSHALTLRIALTGERYQDQAAAATFWTNLVERVRSLPGVEAASVVRGAPIGDWSGQFFTTENQPRPPAGQVPDANYVVVGPDYFRALSIPLRKGRTFDDRDTQAADGVVIVNEELARVQWPGADPIGKRLRMGTGTGSDPWLIVVGVVGNVLTQGTTVPAQREIYVPYQQYPWVLSPDHLVLRTARDVRPDSVANAVVRVLNDVDADQPAADIRTVDRLAAEWVAQPRMVTALLGAFALLALGLAALGIYGVLAYSVAQRRREIGIRVALGAPRPTVLRLVIGEGARLALIGIGVGLIASLALTRLLTTLLYGVRPTDVPTFLAGALVLSSTSLLACYIPSRQATRVNPIDVLKEQ
jgi:putative ABC transport system permease protein